MLKLYKIQKNLIHLIVYFQTIWFSTHYSNTVVLYPMFAENRRLERTDRIYEFFDNVDNLNVVDYSSLEKENIFLEGTGALVLDRKNKKAYCSLSQRADEKLLDIFCEDAGYKKNSFPFNIKQLMKKEKLYIIRML